MENELETHFEKISTKIISMIPEPWSLVKLFAYVQDESLTSFFYYKSKNGNQVVYSYDIPSLFPLNKEKFEEDDQELIFMIDDLTDAFLETNQELWKSFTLTIIDDGKLKIEYNYDEEFENSLIAQIVWTYHHFGLKPNSKYELELLINYLEKHTQTNYSIGIVEGCETIRGNKKWKKS
ncbi:immunity protein YezG family protein [Alkalihalophilus sp. As8PL]|uniref:Immunity protein YezG family protein n=1 Tax=Alkalihalophilus sp. As8PL TaxID=3237103 RepID=A0AB39BQ25_9BACI